MEGTIRKVLANIKSEIGKRSGKARDVDTGINTINVAATYVSRSKVDELIDLGLLNGGNIDEFYRTATGMMVSAASEAMRGLSHSEIVIAPYPTLKEGDYPYSDFLPYLVDGYEKYIHSLYEAYKSGGRKNISIFKMLFSLEELHQFTARVCLSDPPENGLFSNLEVKIEELRDLCGIYFTKPYDRKNDAEIYEDELDEEPQ